MPQTEMLDLLECLVLEPPWPVRGRDGAGRTRDVHEAVKDLTLRDSDAARHCKPLHRMRQTTGHVRRVRSTTHRASPPEGVRPGRLSSHSLGLPRDVDKRTRTDSLRMSA